MLFTIDFVHSQNMVRNTAVESAQTALAADNYPVDNTEVAVDTASPAEESIVPTVVACPEVSTVAAEHTVDTEPEPVAVAAE